MVFSPAKVNLFLAITGRRADGFHDLVSVATPLDFGDELHVDARAAGNFTLTCDQPDLAVDGSNLILKAAAAFVAATGWTGGARFRLAKRIPMGAGLGGGSSNAVAALHALNELSGGVLPPAQLAAVAQPLGSDCALFLHEGPVVMRGRGENVAPLPPAAAARIRGRHALLFKPSFGINTAWAYGRMAARARAGAADVYRPAVDAERSLAEWICGGAPLENLVANNMESVAFDKFVALPVLQAKLQREFGVVVGMSGSGSACFALLPGTAAMDMSGEGAALVSSLTRVIRECWGTNAFVQAVRLA